MLRVWVGMSLVSARLHALNAAALVTCNPTARLHFGQNDPGSISVRVNKQHSSRATLVRSFWNWHQAVINGKILGGMF